MANVVNIYFDVINDKIKKAKDTEAFLGATNWQEYVYKVYGAEKGGKDEKTTQAEAFISGIISFCLDFKNEQVLEENKEVYRSKITFADSVLRLLRKKPIKFLPEHYYIYISDGRKTDKTTGKKIGNPSNLLAITPQYQSCLQWLTSIGYKICLDRSDYVTAKEIENGKFHDTIHEDGRKTIMHQPDRMERLGFGGNAYNFVDLVKTKKIVLTYLAYYEPYQNPATDYAKYLIIDHSSLMQSVNASSNSGTKWKIAKAFTITAVHRLAGLVINQDIDDEEDQFIKYNSNDAETPQRKSKTNTVNTDPITNEPIMNDFNKVPVDNDGVFIPSVVVVQDSDAASDDSEVLNELCEKVKNAVDIEYIDILFANIVESEISKKDKDTLLSILEAKKKILECKTNEDLLQVWTSLPNECKTSCVSVKDVKKQSILESQATPQM